MTRATDLDGRIDQNAAPRRCRRRRTMAVGFAIASVRALWPPAPGPTLADVQTAQRADETPGHWLPGSLLGSIGAKAGARPLWQPGALAVGDDLYPHIRRLLGMGGGDQDGADRFAEVAELGADGRKLVGGKRLVYPRGLPAAERRALRLALLLTDAARGRIAGRVAGFDGAWLPLEVTEVRRVVFRTGQGILLARVAIAPDDGRPPDPYLVVEALALLARVNRLTWLDAEGARLADAPTFSLGTLLRGLLAPGAAAPRSDRVFSLTYLRLAARPDPSALDALLTRLARHYTDDYRPADAPVGVVDVRHFANVAHRFAPEGGASVLYPLDGAELPPFLADYERKTFRGHYLPIGLLAYHELGFLLDATAAAGIWPDGTDNVAANDIALLERVRLSLTRFSLCFRFSRVSRIGMHNDVNAALRSALGLDRMLDELDRDSAQIDAYLSRVAERRDEARAARQERRWRWASMLGVLGIAWLTSFTIAKELLALEAMAGWLSWSPGLTALVQIGVSTAIAVGAALAVGSGGLKPR